MGTSTNGQSANEEFVYLINIAMKRGIENGADQNQMAKICINTARELYDYYDAGDDYRSFQEFVVSAGFESAEIEEWLDAVEGRTFRKGNE